MPSASGNPTWKLTLPFSLPLKERNGQIHEILVFQTLKSGNKGQQPWEMRNKQGEPYCWPSSLLSESFQGGTKEGLCSQLLGLWRGSWVSMESKAARVPGTKAQWWERGTEREHRSMKRVSFKFPAEYWPGRACEETAWGQGKKLLKIRSFRAWCSHGIENHTYSHHPEQNTHGPLWRALRKILPQLRE